MLNSSLLSDVAAAPVARTVMRDARGADVTAYLRLTRASAALSAVAGSVNEHRVNLYTAKVVKSALESGNLTQHVLMAADPMKTFEALHGVAPSTLGGVPLHKNDPRAKLMAAAVESVVVGEVTTSAEPLLQDMSRRIGDVFDKAQVCLADLRGKLTALEPLMRQVSYFAPGSKTVAAPPASRLVSTLSSMKSAIATLPHPSIAVADMATLHHSVHTAGSAVGLRVLGDDVIAEPGSVADPVDDVEVGTVDDLGYDPVTVNEVKTDALEMVNAAGQFLDARDVIMQRLQGMLALSTETAPRDAVMSQMAAWVNSYNQLITGAVTHAAEAVATLAAVLTEPGVDTASLTPAADAVPSPVVAPDYDLGATPDVPPPAVPDHPMTPETDIQGDVPALLSYRAFSLD